MRAEVDGRLDVIDADHDTALALAARATFRNPERVKLERLGKRGWGVPEYLNLWSRDGDDLILPRGLVTDLRRLAPLCPITDRRVTLEPVSFHWRGDLRSEQKVAARKAFEAQGGIAVGPCGSGKTQIGLGCIAAWRQPALWIVHTSDLARQALERARQLFDLPDEAFGLIGDGKDSLGTHLTVATVQTLVRRDLRDLAGRFGAVVLDEAHHAPARTFLEVIQAFPARYRLGLTATPDRADGLGAAMVAVFGPISARLTTPSLVTAGRLVLPAVRQVPTRFSFTYAGDYGALLAALCEDAARNRLIVETIATEAHRGHTCLVLSDRVAHCHTLAALLNEMAPDVPCAVMTGQATGKRRGTILDGVRAGSIQVLFATKLADEGLDLPVIDRLFLATGGRSVVAGTQRVGRAMRPAAGKDGALVVDFCDWCCPVLAAQARARAYNVYRPLGARVVRETA